MKTIRVFEVRVHVEFATGAIPGFVHLYAGEEAVATGVCMHLNSSDVIGSTHRGHRHCIAKGVDVVGMCGQGRVDAYLRPGPWDVGRKRNRGWRTATDLWRGISRKIQAETRRGSGLLRRGRVNRGVARESSAAGSFQVETFN